MKTAYDKDVLHGIDEHNNKLTIPFAEYVESEEQIFQAAEAIKQNYETKSVTIVRLLP